LACLVRRRTESDADAFRALRPSDRRRLGFVPYGIEPKAMRVAGRFLDNELLQLDLSESRV